MTEQQTPASVVERLRANTELLSGCDECVAKTSHGEVRHMIDGDQICLDVDAILAHVERLSAERAALREAAQTAHGTLIELNPSNYDHDDVCQANAASVEAILILADVLGERHGKTDDWWDSRRAALTQGESRQSGERAFPARSADVIVRCAHGVPAPYLCAVCVDIPAAPTPAGGGGE